MSDPEDKISRAALHRLIILEAQAFHDVTGQRLGIEDALRLIQTFPAIQEEPKE